jgi:hypothetical protein
VKRRTDSRRNESARSASRKGNVVAVTLNGAQPRFRLPGVAGLRVYNTPQASVMYAAQVLRNLANRTPEQERIRVMLETTAVMLNRGQPSAHPAPSGAGSTRTQ